MKILQRRSGFSLFETLVAVAVTTLVIAATTVGVLSLQRSFVRSKQYSVGMNDGSRLIDYVSRDLRNALKISRRVLGVPTRVGAGTSVEISDTNQLSIFVPDYFVSNIPDNSSGSDYKLPRFSRSRLPADSGHFGYNDIVTVIGTMRVAKYPGELEVRYLKKARSTQDPTLCFFRQEYEGGTLRSERDIAENVESATLIVRCVYDSEFQVVSSFSPKWATQTTKDATQQFSTVKLPNTRRD